MASSDHLANDSVDSPLLDDFVDGSVDHKGQPVRRSTSGGWRSAGYIIGVEIGERFAYYGIAANLISYLTGPLGQSTVVAAENVNVWDGIATLLPLLGGFVADSYLGRYWTILFASLLYILGLGLLTLSAILTSNRSWECTSTKTDIALCSSSKFEVFLLFFSLYLVAIGQGGHKPCVQAFGADQFDRDDPRENKSKSSFFNWWYLGLCAGCSATMLIVVYIQENLNWSLGFGVPCIVMLLSLAIFLLGTKTYRFGGQGIKKKPFVRIGNVFVSAVRNWRIQAPSLEKDLLQPDREQFKFLNKALLVHDEVKESDTTCSVSDVEEAKSVLRLIPIWSSSLVFAIVDAQTSTFFTKQGATMDRVVTSELKIPAASLQVFSTIAIVITMPIYERVFVPIARSFTNKPSGITTLQRIGTGIFLSIVTMVVALLVEMKRLETAKIYGLVESPEATIPMSIWWLTPQCVLFGIAQAFTMVGLQEFFYDQVPDDLKSIGIALYLSVFGVGSILSSIIVSVIEKITTSNGGEGWFPDNLNKAHLDYFYLLLAGMCALGLTAFIYFARSYIYISRRRT